MKQVGSVLNGVFTPPYPAPSSTSGGSQVRFSANPVVKAAAHLPYPIARNAKQQVWHRLSFGGNILNHLTDALVPIFQKITEVYVVSFLAMDVIGLWAPRIWTSAKTGRIAYDPSKDPEAKDKPFGEQVKLWIKGNIKGLNWPNLEEETAREAATGPGLLVIPSVMYAFAGRALGRTGIHLRHEALNGFCNGFAEHVSASNLAQAGKGLSQADYRRTMGDYISSLFKDTEMRKAHMPDGGGTYGEFLDQWSQRWANAMNLDTSKVARKEQEKTLAKLGDELQEKIIAFNQEHRLQTYQMDGKTIGAKASDSMIHRVDHIWGSYAGKGPLQQMPMRDLLSDLSKWTDVSRGIYKTQNEKLAAAADAKLPEVIEFVRRKVVSHKTLFSVSATVLGAMYLFQLVFWTQRHKSYQATRLLHEDKATPAQPGQIPGPSSNAPSHSEARSAFLANNTNQPAFPVYGQGPVFNMNANAVPANRFKGDWA